MDLIYKQDAIDAIRNIIAIKGTFDDEILLIDKVEAQTACRLAEGTKDVERRKINYGGLE